MLTCLRPAAVACPGAPGNRKEDGQPGEWAFGSQSTYILPNPAYTAGSKLAPFVYFGDRWAPSTAFFGLYVWLPLFIDKTGTKMSVVWHDYWRLDNATSPFD